MSFIVKIGGLIYTYLNKESYYNQDTNLFVLGHENNFFNNIICAVLKNIIRLKNHLKKYF